MSVEEFFMGILGILFIVTVICVCCNIACYLIKAFTLFVLAKRANAPRAWFAFIPFLQNMKLYNLAGYSEKAFLIVWLASLLLGCIPIPELLFIWGLLHTVITVYVRVRVAQNFGGDVGLIILNVLFEPFVLIYLALSDRKFALRPEWQPLDTFLHRCNLDTNFAVKKRSFQ